MAETGSHPQPLVSHSGHRWVVVRTPPEQRIKAAALLNEAPLHQAMVGARRMIENASEFGINPNLIWHVSRSDDPTQMIGSCMVVFGAGRTATVFASPRLDASCDVDALASCISSAVRCMLSERGMERLLLFQTLAEPHQVDLVRAFVAAGFSHITDLDYMSRKIVRDDRPKSGAGDPGWSQGRFIARPMGMVVADERERLVQAIDGSYENTLDCPELCNARPTSDVLDSHIAAGDGDTSMWQIVECENKPVGCCLVSRSPDGRAADLIYIGLAPEARGHGLGKKLVQTAIHQLALRRLPTLRCAVDQRNAAARTLYESLGFLRTESRCALVATSKQMHSVGSPETSCRSPSEAHKS